MKRAQSWPIISLLFSCLLLQRFGLSLGGAGIPCSLFCAILVISISALRGQLVLDLRTTRLFVSFVVVTLSITIISTIYPANFAQTSVTSLVYLVLLYALLCFRFRTPLPFQEGIAHFRGFATFLGGCGILQFLVQFAGVSVFEFEGLFPAILLVEEGYNLAIPISHGAKIFKSNGFFLLEPSIFSQILALGLIVELVYFKRLSRCILYATGMVISFSGTGLLTLGFSIGVICILDPKVAKSLAGFGILAMLLGGILYAVFPEYLAIFSERSETFNSEESSAYFRFISPYKMIFDLSHEPRFLLGFGPGTAERLNMGYDYDINALIKMLVEYGPIGLCLYWLILLRVFYRADARVISLACIFTFIMGGGYALAPPFVLLFAALTTYVGDPGPLPETQ